jgi:hypothetical protein
MGRFFSRCRIRTTLDRVYSRSTALAKRQRNAVLPGISSDSATHTQPLTLPLALDAELGRVVAAWPDLPAPIRAAMLALIGVER